MANILLSLIISAIFTSVGLSIFPTFHNLLNSVDTTGMIPIVVFLVKSLPYVLSFIIVYAAVQIIAHKTQG